jgi:hypothetical protein
LKIKKIYYFLLEKLINLFFKQFEICELKRMAKMELNEGNSTRMEYIWAYTFRCSWMFLDVV